MSGDARVRNARHDLAAMAAISTQSFLRVHVRAGPEMLLYCRSAKTSNIGTGPPLVTTVGITPFHFSTARP